MSSRRAMKQFADVVVATKSKHLRSSPRAWQLLGNLTASSVMVLRFPEVQRLVGLSRSTIERLEKTGQFPKRVALSARNVGWMADDVETWIRQRQKASA